MVILLLLVGCSWFLWLRWREAMAASAATAVEIGRLRSGLTDRDGRLAGALSSAERLRAELVSRSRVEVRPVYKVKEMPRPSKPLRGEGTTDFRHDCEDWQDADGRFVFHQATRTLDVNLRFRIESVLTRFRSGRVTYSAQLFELSPSDGTVLREWPVTVDTKTVGAERGWVLGVGAAWDPVHGRIDPQLLLTRPLPGGLYAGGILQPNVAAAFFGISFPLQRSRVGAEEPHP